MTYQGIIERVRAATGPSKELDIAIHKAATGEKYRPAHWDDDGPGYSFSIDAALALAEKLLPGCKVLMGMRQTPDTLPWARVGEWAVPDATGETLPLAIILATLLALQSQEPK